MVLDCPVGSCWIHRGRRWLQSDTPVFHFKWHLICKGDGCGLRCGNVWVRVRGRLCLILRATACRGRYGCRRDSGKSCWNRLLPYHSTQSHPIVHDWTRLSSVCLSIPCCKVGRVVRRTAGDTFLWVSPGLMGHIPISLSDFWLFSMGCRL
jgi:hypothetical protein